MDLNALVYVYFHLSELREVSKPESLTAASSRASRPLAQLANLGAHLESPPALDPLHRFCHQAASATRWQTTSYVGIVRTAVGLGDDRTLKRGPVLPAPSEAEVVGALLSPGGEVDNVRVDPYVLAARGYGVVSTAREMGEGTGHSRQERGRARRRTSGRCWTSNGGENRWGRGEQKRCRRGRGR